MLRKIILFLVFCALIALVVVALRMRMDDSNGTSAEDIVLPEEKSATARLYIDPVRAEVSDDDDSVEFVIMVDTDNQPIQGVDVSLLFPPTAAVVSSEIDTSASVFDMFLDQTVNQKDGRLTISAVAEPGTTFSGVGEVGRIMVSPTEIGEIELIFDYTPGGTTDSNVASNGQDVLGEVTNGVLIYQP